MLGTFGVATLALLALPGPTNALFAAAGASKGIPRSLPLISFAIAGYGVAIGSLMTLFSPAGVSSPLLFTTLRFGAGAWLVWSAWRLWRLPTQSPASLVVTRARLFVTSLLNPKALVFASAIFPSAEAASLPARVGIFMLAVAATGSAWIAIGSFITETATEAATPWRIARISAVCLLGFALWVIGWAVATLTG